MGKCLSRNSDPAEPQDSSRNADASVDEEAEDAISHAQLQLTVNYKLLTDLIKNDGQILKLRYDHYTNEVLNAAVKKICNEKDEITNTYFLCLKYFDQVFVSDNNSNHITPEERKERIRRAKENVGCLKSDFEKLRRALGDAEGRLENVRDGEARTSTVNKIQDMRATLFKLITCTTKMQSMMMKEKFERNEENEKTMHLLMLDLSSKVIQVFYSYKDELREMLYDRSKMLSQTDLPNLNNTAVAMVKIEAHQEFAMYNHVYHKAYTFHRCQQFGNFRKNCDNVTRIFGFFEKTFKLQEPSLISTCGDIRRGLDLSQRPDLTNILQVLSDLSGTLLSFDLSWSENEELFSSLRQQAKVLVDNLHTLFSTIQSKIEHYQRHVEPTKGQKEDEIDMSFSSCYEEIRKSIRELSEIVLKFNVGDSPAFDDALNERPALTLTEATSASQTLFPMRPSDN